MSHAGVGKKHREIKEHDTEMQPMSHTVCDECGSLVHVLKLSVCFELFNKCH
jgi:hypothetical protein